MSSFRLLSQQVFLVGFGVFELFFFSSVCRIFCENCESRVTIYEKNETKMKERKVSTIQRSTRSATRSPTRSLTRTRTRCPTRGFRIRLTFDKLGVIKNELAMIDENWSESSFVQFLEALEKWTINNPIPESQRHKVMAISNNKREKSTAFYAKRDDGNQTTTRRCLFCESPITEQSSVIK